MIERFAKGVIPEPGVPALPEIEARLTEAARTLPEQLERGFVRPRLENLQAIWGLIGLCDEYIDKAAPGNSPRCPTTSLVSARS
ncbi:MAG: hypothetical protein U0361_23040 [Nitrospiraceae bacterium]